MLRRVLPVIIALALAGAAVASSAGGPQGLSAASQLLPDLDQEAPWNLEVTGSEARGGYRLGFSSAVRNVGAGPLIVSGRRRAATPTMTVDQLVEQKDAPIAVVEDVGRMRYVRSPDHEHWHLLGFERYELRRAVREGTGGHRPEDRVLPRRPVPGEGPPAAGTTAGACVHKPLRP